MHTLTFVGSVCSIVGLLVTIYIYLNPNKKEK